MFRTIQFITRHLKAHILVILLPKVNNSKKFSPLACLEQQI